MQIGICLRGWTVYKITDARGRPIAWCYYRHETALRNEYPSQEEAKEVVKSIARLSRKAPAPGEQ